MFISRKFGWTKSVVYGGGLSSPLGGLPPQLPPTLSSPLCNTTKHNEPVLTANHNEQITTVDNLQLRVLLVRHGAVTELIQLLCHGMYT